MDFFNEYAVRDADGNIPPWFQFDFGKPNISLAHASRKDYVPVSGQVWYDPRSQRALVEMSFDAAVVANAGAPAQAWFEFFEGQQGDGDLRLQVRPPPPCPPMRDAPTPGLHRQQNCHPPPGVFLPFLSL